MFSRPDCRPQGTVDFGGTGHQRASLAHSFANGQYWTVNEAKTQVLFYDHTTNQQEEVYTVTSGDISEDDEDSGTIEYLVPFTLEIQGSEFRPQKALWVATTNGCIAIITVDNRIVVRECFLGRPVVVVSAVDGGKLAIKRPSKSFSCGELLLACKGEMADLNSKKEIQTNHIKEQSGGKEYNFEIVCVSFIVSSEPSSDGMIYQKLDEGAFKATAICNVVCGVVGSILPTLTASGVCEEMYIIGNNNQRQRDSISIWSHNVGMKSTTLIGTYVTPVDKFVTLNTPVRSLLSSMPKNKILSNESEAVTPSKATYDHSERRTTVIWISNGSNVHIFFLSDNNSTGLVNTITLPNMHQCTINNMFSTALGNVIWTVDESSKAVVWDTSDAQPLGTLCLRSYPISSSGTIQKTDKGSLHSTVTGVDGDGSVFSLSIEEALIMHNIVTVPPSCHGNEGAGNEKTYLSQCCDFINYICTLLKQSGKSTVPDSDTMDTYEIPTSLVKFLEGDRKHRAQKKKGSTSPDHNARNNKHVAKGGDDDISDSLGVGVRFIPEAIHTLVVCRAMIVNAFNKLNWTSSSFQDDIQKLISCTTHYRSFGGRARELVEKIAKLCPMYPVPADITDPIDGLLFAAECCVEVLQEKIDSEIRKAEEIARNKKKQSMESTPHTTRYSDVKPTFNGEIIENRDYRSSQHPSSVAVNSSYKDTVKAETVDNQAVYLLEKQIRELKEEVDRLKTQNITSHNEHTDIVRSYKEDIRALNERMDSSSSRYEMQVEHLKQQLSQALSESESMRELSASKNSNSVTPQRNRDEEERIMKLATQAAKRSEDLRHSIIDKEATDVIINSLKEEVITKNRLIKELITQCRSLDDEMKENKKQTPETNVQQLQHEITQLGRELEDAAKTEDRLQSRVSHLQVKLREGRHLSKELREWVLAQYGIPSHVVSAVEKRLLFMHDYALSDTGENDQQNGVRAHQRASSDLVDTPFVTGTDRGVSNTCSSINSSCRISVQDSNSSVLHQKRLHSGIQRTALPLSPPIGGVSTSNRLLAVTLHPDHYSRVDNKSYQYDRPVSEHSTVHFVENPSSGGYVQKQRSRTLSNERIAEAVMETLQRRNENSTVRYVTDGKPQLISNQQQLTSCSF